MIIVIVVLIIAVVVHPTLLNFNFSRMLDTDYFQVEERLCNINSSFSSTFFEILVGLSKFSLSSRNLVTLDLESKCDNDNLEKIRIFGESDT